MQITINLKTMGDDAIRHLAEAFLAECNVAAQLLTIAEQRSMMFMAVSNEMAKRGLSPGSLDERFVRSIATTILTANSRRFKNFI